MKTRLHYFILVIAIMISGLLLRKNSLVPVWIGDMLYALMMYFMVRIILLNKKPWFVCLLSSAICVAIECSQLLHAGWIDAIRKTLPGRLILGQGFLWSDLAAYAIGAVLGLIMDTVNRRLFLNRKH